MRDLSVVDRPPTCKYSMTRTLPSISSLRTPAVDRTVDGRVDWHAVALIGKAICGRMSQRFEQHDKGEISWVNGNAGACQPLSGKVGSPLGADDPVDQTGLPARFAQKICPEDLPRRFAGQCPGFLMTRKEE